MNPISPDHPLN